MADPQTRAVLEPLNTRALNHHVPVREVRRQIERMLHDLCAVGYLDHAPAKVDGHFGQDPAARRAIAQFLEFNGFSDGLVPQAVERLRERWVSCCPQIYVCNWQTPTDADSDLARKHPWRLRDSYGQVRVAWGENVRVAIVHGHLPEAATSLPAPVDYTVKLEVMLPGGASYAKLAERKGATQRVVEVAFDGSLLSLVPGEAQHLLPVGTEGALVVTAPHPERSGAVLEIVQPLMVHRLENVTPLRDDNGREWFVSDQIAQQVLALKEKVNAEGGELRFNSTVRTFSKQMALWARYKRRVPGQNPANQPGTSWHETGRAIDISVWDLDMNASAGARSSTEGIPRSAFDQAVVETDEAKAAGRVYLEHLDAFRAFALELGFTLASDRFARYPWNVGYAQARASGTVAAVRYADGLKYVFHLVIQEASSPHLLRNQRLPVREGEITLSWEGGVQAVVARGQRPRVKRRGARSAVTWVVEASDLGLPPARAELACVGQFVTFAWSTGRRQHTVHALVEALDLEVEAYELSVETNPTITQSNLYAVPTPRRLVLSSTADLSRQVTVDADEVEDPTPGALVFTVRAPVWNRAARDLSPFAVAGWSVSFVTEDRALYQEDGALRQRNWDVAGKSGALPVGPGRYAPAFQRGMSEKHHFQQIQVPIVGREGWEEVVDGLNAAVDAFVARLEKIERESGETGLVRQWKIRRYEATPVLRAASYIHNVPDPAGAMAAFLTLADEIEAEVAERRAQQAPP